MPSSPPSVKRGGSIRRFVKRVASLANVRTNGRDSTRRGDAEAKRHSEDGPSPLFVPPSTVNMRKEDAAATPTLPPPVQQSLSSSKAVTATSLTQQPPAVHTEPQRNYASSTHSGEVSDSQEPSLSGLSTSPSNNASFTPSSPEWPRGLLPQASLRTLESEELASAEGQPVECIETAEAACTSKDLAATALEPVSSEEVAPSPLDDNTPTYEESSAWTFPSSRVEVFKRTEERADVDVCPTLEEVEVPCIELLEPTPYAAVCHGIRVPHFQPPELLFIDDMDVPVNDIVAEQRVVQHSQSSDTRSPIAPENVTTFDESSNFSAESVEVTNFAAEMLDVSVKPEEESAAHPTGSIQADVALFEEPTPQFNAENDASVDVLPMTDVLTVTGGAPDLAPMSLGAPEDELSVDDSRDASPVVGMVASSVQEQQATAAVRENALSPEDTEPLKFSAENLSDTRVAAAAEDTNLIEGYPAINSLPFPGGMQNIAATIETLPLLDSESPTTNEGTISSDHDEDPHFNNDLEKIIECSGLIESLSVSNGLQINEHPSASDIQTETFSLGTSNLFYDNIEPTLSGPHDSDQVLSGSDHISIHSTTEQDMPDLVHSRDSSSSTSSDYGDELDYPSYRSTVGSYYRQPAMNKKYSTYLPFTHCSVSHPGVGYALTWWLSKYPLH